MFRHLPILLVVALAAAWYPSGYLMANPDSLIAESTAARHGLTRPWFAQLELAQAGARVTDVVLNEGVLFVQSDAAMVQAIDAETGKTLWARQVGRRGHPSLTPGVNHELVVVVNGSRMYVVNRQTGALLAERALEAAPSLAIALSATRAYIPLVGGMVAAHKVAYLMDQGPSGDSVTNDSAPADKASAASPPAAPAAAASAAAGGAKSAAAKAPSAKSDSAKPNSASPGASPADSADADTPQPDQTQSATARGKLIDLKPLICHSIGQISAPPLVTRETPVEEYLSWCDDRGHLNIAQLDRRGQNGFQLIYRLATESQIVCPAAYRPPDANVLGASGIIFVASITGYVHAVQEKDGTPLWRFSTGESIVTAPVTINDELYVATAQGGMYCFQAKTGKPIWLPPEARQFVAASKSRVYATDAFGRILILNAASGARLGAMAAENVPIKFVNNDTDRIYLVDNHGLLQCLHEVGQVQPLVHVVHHQQVDVVEEQPGGEAKKAPEPKPKKEPAPKKEKAASDEPAKERPAAKEKAPAKERAPKEKAAPKERLTAKERAAAKKAAKEAAKDAAAGQ